MTDKHSFLKHVALFADLSDADLEIICQQIQEVRLISGEILFEEGSLGQFAYIIREGQIEIYKNTNGRSVQLAVRQRGEMIGEIALLEATPRNASGRALTDSLLYSIGQEQFDHLLEINPTVARTMLHTVITRLRSIDLALRQSEKMAQLGNLTAGIAHELNNPASAVQRGAEQFKKFFAKYRQQLIALKNLNLPVEQIQSLLELATWSGKTVLMTPVERSDREGEIEEWLEEMGASNGWEKAPLLVNLGYEPETLKKTLAGFPANTIPSVLDWITSSAELDSIANEISQGAGRISEIVKALKSYVYLDQAPVQSVNIHEGLENTLVILRHKIKQGITLERLYDPTIPAIQASGSELNQLWTNIIDNAIDAMDGHGKMTIQTTYHDPWVIVDIADNGPGIPPEIQSKLFDPFFTTKPIGKGTGLGLKISYNIVQKHRGDIKITSVPGETHFEVWLPVDGKKLAESSTTLQPEQAVKENVERRRSEK